MEVLPLLMALLAVRLMIRLHAKASHNAGPKAPTNHHNGRQTRVEEISGKAARNAAAHTHEIGEK